MTGVIPGDSPRPCPAVITTLLKEIYIDGQVDLDENPMAFESAEELGYLPPLEDGDYMEEWEAESMFQIFDSASDLILTYCSKQHDRSALAHAHLPQGHAQDLLREWMKTPRKVGSLETME